MLAYALRRLVLAVPLLLGITLISFVVIHLAPGEPVDLQTGDLSVQSSAQAKQLLREVYGLDKPLTVQYWNWLGRLARLDFGRSFARSEEHTSELQSQSNLVCRLLPGKKNIENYLS